MYPCWKQLAFQSKSSDINRNNLKKTWTFFFFFHWLMFKKKKKRQNQFTPFSSAPSVSPASSSQVECRQAFLLTHRRNQQSYDTRTTSNTREKKLICKYIVNYSQPLENLRGRKRVECGAFLQVCALLVWQMNKQTQRTRTWSACDKSNYNVFLCVRAFSSPCPSLSPSLHSSKCSGNWNSISPAFFAQQIKFLCTEERHK